MKKIIILLLSGLLVSCIQSDKQKADNLYRSTVAKSARGSNAEEFSKAFEQIETLDPDYPDLYYIWGVFLLNYSGKERSDSLMFEGLSKLDKALKISPQHAGAYVSKGLALTGYGTKLNDDSIRNEGMAAYQKALEINPNKADAYCHWGITLAEQAAKNKDEKLMEEALILFRKADNVTGEKYSINYMAWGSALVQLGKIKDDEALYREGVELCKQGVDMFPNMPQGYSNLAISLVFLAEKIKEPNYCKEAIKLYDKSADLGNDMIFVSEGKAYTYWTLGKLEGRVPDYETDIVSLYTKSEKLGSQAAAYNLACYYSSIDEKETALQWLETSLTHDYKIKVDINREKIAEDEEKDFLNIRNDKRFKELIQTHFN